MEEKKDKQEIRVCNKCGYQRGFHVYFEDIAEGKARIGLICPHCGQSYDIGWIIPNVSISDPIEREIYEEIEK